MQYHSRKGGEKVEFSKTTSRFKKFTRRRCKIRLLQTEQTRYPPIPRVTGKVRQLWDFAFLATVTYASFDLWFFGGVGNSFIDAFRLYLRCNQWKGEQQYGAKKEPLRSDTTQPPRPSNGGQRAVGPDHRTVHHQPVNRILRNERKWR